MIRRCVHRHSKFRYLLYFTPISSASFVYYAFIKEYSTVIIATTTTTTATVNIFQHIGRQSCVSYTEPDNRSFFEREPPQLNLPRKISDTFHKDLLQHLQSLQLFVLATARNVANNIDKFRIHIEPIVDLFHPSSRILICESDSNDNTVEKLYQWPKAQVYTYGNMVQSYPSRPERIAFCRNKLLNLTHQTTADYILMVDVDVFASNVSSFLTNFQYNTDDWSGMTATAREAYYDIWALRTLSDSNLNYNVWRRIGEMQQPGTNYCSESVIDQIIRIHQKQIPANHSLIEVRSAFNGAGLYKTNATYGCQYSGAGLTCEHVPFHLCMREKNHGRIFINPAFVLD